MTDQAEKYTQVLEFAEVALSRSQRRSDQLSLSISVVAGGIIGICFSVLPGSGTALWARLLLGALALAALTACGLVLMVADPTTRVGATDPQVIAQRALAPALDSLWAVTTHLTVVLGEYARFQQRVKVQTARAVAALLLASATTTVAFVLTLVEV